MFKLLSDLFIRLLIRVYNQKYADALKTWNLQVGSKSNLETTETACSFDYCISKFLFFLKVAPFYYQLLFSPLWQDSLEKKGGRPMAWGYSPPRQRKVMAGVAVDLKTRLLWVTLYPQPGKRKQWILLLYLVPSFYSVQDPNQWNSSTHIQGGLPQ